MINLMQWSSTKQLLLLWLLMLGISSTYARHSTHFRVEATNAQIKAHHLQQADSCTAEFLANSLNNKLRLVLFNNQSTTTIGVANGEVVYQWFFGDGIFSFEKDPRHSYSANGTYQVCLVQKVRDSITLREYCVDSICKNVVVNYIPPVCNVEYVVDTANSQLGNVIAWNSSIPNSLDTLHTVYYKWYFGDGDSSELAFPTHQYEKSGEYEVCLTMWSYDSVNNLCTETYCDNFGADGEGNLIYKNGSEGFTLNIMDPFTIGKKEFNHQAFSVYPNPASHYVKIDGIYNSAKGGKYIISDLKGTELKSGWLEGDQKGLKKIDITALKEGLYVLQICVNGRFPVSCYKLRVDR